MTRRFLPVLLLGAILLLPGMAAGSAAPERGGGENGSSGISGAGRLQLAQAGEITPEKIERWRRMTPEQRERIRERYRRWKSLPPERRNRVLKRRRTWRSLPPETRRYLRDRREIYRRAGPEERRAIRKFVRGMREMPPHRQRQMRQRIGELRKIPGPDRESRMMAWPLYRTLSPAERDAVNRFLFARPPGNGRGGGGERAHE